MSITKRSVEIRRVVTEERARAESAGEPWTTYRPFVNALERCGAMRCGICRRQSRFVSYSTAIAGRTVICQRCYDQTVAAGVPVCPNR